jgi:hypothetical protein
MNFGLLAFNFIFIFNLADELAGNSTAKEFLFTSVVTLSS